jgi:ketosteroid isomerase-like protein
VNAVLLLVCVLATGCAGNPDEEALRASIAAMQEAVEQRSLSGVMERVTDDFGGSEGLDRATLQRILQGQIIANAKIGATIGPISIERQGDRASASFSLILTGGSGRFLPERGRAYRITSGWRVEDGEWKVYVAEWDGEDRS